MRLAANAVLASAVLAAGSLVLGIAASRTVLSQQEPAPTKAGWVDIERVMTAYRKRTLVGAELEKRRDGLNQQFKQRRQQIEEKRDKLATLSTEGDEFLRLEREVDLEMLAFKRDREFEDARLAAEQSQKLGMIYREICSEARVQAESRGLAAVYAYQPLQQGFEKRPGVLGLIANRDILWADGRLDLTEPVLQALNSQLPPAPAEPGTPGGGK
jgi:Skp family chaperone for outer membrane proteins